MSLKNKIKLLMNKVNWEKKPAITSANDFNHFGLQIVISEQRLMLTQRAKEIEALQNRIDSMKVQLVPSYTEQHFNWANKEMIRLGNMVREYSENNELLNVDNMKLRHDRIHDLNQIGGLQEDNSRLQSIVDLYEMKSIHTCSKGCKKDGCSRGLRDEIESLKAEVKRLRKAGDAMERSLAFEYPDSPKVKEWQAAKEGKPSV